MREVKPEDVGWLAGIIDGEGSILFNKPKGIYANKILYSIYIVGTDMSLLKKCERIINQLIESNGKKYNLAVKRYKQGIFKTNKQTYVIQIWRQESLRQLLEAVLPHLTEKYLKSARLLNFLQKHKKGTWFRGNEVEDFLNFTPAETK